MPVTPAANAIVTATDVKGYIKLIGTADDDLIQNIINGVSILIENYCAAKFINQAITEVVDGSGAEIQIVEFCPISALTEVQYYFDTASPTVMPLTDFIINKKSGMIKSIYAGFPEGWQNIQIKYTAGIGAAIANLPDDLKLAAMKQCQFFYERDSADFSMTFEEGMIVKAPPEMLSPAVKDMLTPYFRARF